MSFFETHPNYGFAVSLLHTFFVGPLLLWTGWKLYNKNSLGSMTNQILYVVGIAVISFHAVKAFQRLRKEESLKESYPLQINTAHALFIGPLVAWVGYKLSNGRQATQLEKLLFIVLGAGALTYHSLKAWREYNKDN